MAEEQLLDFFLMLNIFYALMTFLAFLFRYRPWRWVAVVKIAGFGLVLLFQLVASVVWLIFGLPLLDILIYALWSLIFGWISAKLGREGLHQLTAIPIMKFQARHGQPGTWLIGVVPLDGQAQKKKAECFHPIEAVQDSTMLLGDWGSRKCMACGTVLDPAYR